MMRGFIQNFPAVAALLAVVLLVPSATALAQQVAPVTSRPLPTPDTSVEPQVILLSVGKTQLIELPLPARDVIVANPAIADIIVKTPTRAYLIGQAVGQTNVFFVGKNGNVILHLAVQVDVELAMAREAIKSLVPTAQVELKALNGSIVMTGVVPSTQASANVQRLVRQFLTGDMEVVNMLGIKGDQQVLLKIRIAEIARTITKEFGINAQITKSFDNKTFSLTNIGVPAAATAFGTIGISAFGIDSVTYGALENRGLTKTLAEPVLTAISGETATFLAGGSVPIAAGVEEGVQTFVLHNIGVAMSFSPLVLANNRISLSISTGIESRSAANSVATSDAAGNTFTLPGFSVNSATTTVNLPSGGNIMIAGLVKKDTTTTISGAPWIKNIPILGALFRSQQFQDNETELVILVTAYVVKPVEFADTLSLPTDGFIAASEADMYLLGRLHKQYTGKQPRKAPQTVVGPFGYIME